MKQHDVLYAKSAFIALAVLVTLAAILGIIAYRNIKPTASPPSGVQQSTPQNPTPTFILKHIDVPDNIHWFEANPTCAALSNSLRIFFPVGWIVGGAQHVFDNVSGDTGSKEYNDSINLVSQCQIFAGYKSEPDGYMSPCTKYDYGVISVAAWINEPAVTLEDMLKNNLAHSKDATNPSHSEIQTLNGRQFLIQEIDPPYFASYTTLNNNYVIRVSHSNCPDYMGSDHNSYFKDTGLEVTKRLLFK